MTQSIFIGVDIGTTGVRAVAYSLEGQALATASQEYPLYTDQSGVAEQNPDDIIAAMESVVAKVGRTLGAYVSYVKGISFSSVLHSFMGVDGDDRPVTQLMTWADTRGQIVMDDLRQLIDAKAVYMRTGCPLHPMYPLLNIFWLKKHQPDVFNRTVRFGSIKDYAIHGLTGKWVVDRSVASGTGLYNIYEREWDKELLQVLGISEDRMIEVQPTTYNLPLTKQAADRLGLPVGISVVLGAGDGMLANVGVGAVKPGQINITIGTSGAARMVAAEPRTDEKGRLWCYNLSEKHWMLGGAINNGGISFRWVRDTFGGSEKEVAQNLGIDSYALLSQYAEKVKPGSDGLILLPFFAGERAPYWNADARGIMFGLTLNHEKRHIIRATLEGVCYRIKSILESLEEVTGKAEQVRVSGSFTRSDVWLQMLSDVLGRTISLPAVEEGAAYGAAILGFYSIGMLPSIEVAADMVGIRKTFEPNSANHEIYEELYHIYEGVYWGVQKQFTEISNFQRNHRG